jgi:cell division protein FtsN
MPYDFSLDRKTTITLSASTLLLIVLVFAAGFLAGVNWGSERTLIALNRGQVSPVKASVAEAQNAVPAGNAAAGTPPAAPAAAPTPVVSAAPAAAPAGPEPKSTSLAADSTTPAAASPAPATDAAPAAESPVKVGGPAGVQLAIQVGSFLDKGNAEKLAERLKEEGYAPQIVVGGHAPKQWNIVRVGPYRDWDEASEIAAVLSRDQPSPAVIRPMR